MARRHDRLAEFRAVIDEFASRHLDDYVGRLALRRSLPSPREFNDPIWGTIVVSSAEVVVIDSPLFQRLQDIRQLGTGHHVYRSANHTRFEHSLGSLHAMTVLIREINEHSSGSQALATASINAQLAQQLRLAALLHDVGHGFMSHVSENAVKSLGWAVDLAAGTREEIGDLDLGEAKKPAELASHYIIRSEAFRALATYLSTECGLGSVPALVRALSRAVLGLPISDIHPFLSHLISGPFDVDKLDYIQRDAYFCGVPEVIDVNRLLRKLRTTIKAPGDLPHALAEGLVDAPESLVVTGIAESGARTLDEFALARSLLTDKVYRHQKTRAQEALVGSAIEILTELSANPISVMWTMTDAEFLALPGAQLAERAGVRARTAAERRRLALAVELRDRFAERRDYVAAYSWSADRGRDDPLDVDQQVAGIDQLRESARRSSSRRQLTEEIARTIRAIYQAIDSSVPVVSAAADLPYLIRIDQSDDPARLKGRALLARAFLVADSGQVILFSDEYPGTEDWSDLYLVNRDFSAVYCPRELSAAAHLACEIVFFRRFGLVTTAAMARQAHADLPEVDELRRRLGSQGFYRGDITQVGPAPAIMRRASTPPRLDNVSTRLREFSSGLAVRIGYATQERTGGLSSAVLAEFVRQLRTDSAVESMLKVLEHLQMFGRNELVQSALASLEAVGVSTDSVVVAQLGEPNESSGAVTYLVKDALEAAGVSFERIDHLADSDRPNVLLLDDFIGLGTRTTGIIKGWLGLSDGARAIPPVAQARLREANVLCAYATGLPGAQERVEAELAETGVTPRVHVQHQTLPTLDAVANISGQFRSAVRTLGAELLRLNKGYAPARAEANALGYGGHGLLVCFPWGAPKQTLTPLWLSGRRRDGYWRALLPRHD